MRELELDRGSPGTGCDQPPGPVRVVGLTGALDDFSARAVEGELADLIAAHGAVTLDLSDVGLVTSGGLAMLERCRGLADQAHHELQLRVRDGSLVRRVLDLVAPQLAASVEIRRDPEPVTG